MELVADVFNDVLEPEADIPKYWQETRFKVLLKKGNPQLPDNYRPIAVLPILYKLFSRIIYDRIKSWILDGHSCDQAGFRAGFSCDDHLFVVTLLSVMFGEFRSPLWLVAVDFRKAFDCLNHGHLWTALHEQGVPAVLIYAL